VTRLNRLLRDDVAIGLALALGALGVYLLTLAPSFAGEEDQGELAAAAATLGNTHPTGYPVFVLLGRVFAMLPLGDLRVIVKLNLMTAVFSAAALFVFYQVFVSLLRGGALSLAPRGGDEHQRAKRPARPDVDGSVRAAAAAGTLTLAFSEQFWKNALNLEVYGLHMLLIALATWLFVRVMREESAAANPRHGGTVNAGSWPLFVYVTGLSFAHHMMTVLLAPALLWMYFSVHGFKAPAWLKMLKASPLFLLGLSAYAYLPIRAAALPPVNWGGPSSWNTLWLHVSGHQYKAMMFRAVEVPVKKFALLLERFPGVMGYLPLLAAGIGLFALYRRDRRLFVFTLLLFAACLFYSLNYDFDDPNFYLHLHLVTALWAGAGVLALARLAAPGTARRAVLAAGFLVPALPLALHVRALDDSGNYATEDFAKNLLAPLDSGAVIISNQSQYLTSPALYLQFVEGYRPDIVVLQESALGFKSHHDQLKSRYPAFFRAHLEGLASSVPRGDDLLDSAAFVTRYRRTIDAVMALRDDMPVYFSPDIDVPRFFPDVRTSPEGLALRAFGLNVPPLPRPITFSYRPLPGNDSDISNIRSYYATAYVNQAILHGHVNDTAAVLDMLRKALAVKPGFPNAVRLLRWVQYGY